MGNFRAIFFSIVLVLVVVRALSDRMRVFRFSTAPAGSVSSTTPPPPPSVAIVDLDQFYKDLVAKKVQQRDLQLVLLSSFGKQDMGQCDVGQKDLELGRRIGNLQAELDGMLKRLDGQRSHLDEFSRAKMILQEEGVSVSDLVLQELMGLDKSAQGVVGEAQKRNQQDRNRRDACDRILASLPSQLEACNLERQAQGQVRAWDLNRIYSQDEDYIRSSGGRGSILAMAKEVGLLIKQSREKGNQRESLKALEASLPAFVEVRTTKGVKRTREGGLPIIFMKDKRKSYYFVLAGLTEGSLQLDDAKGVIARFVPCGLKNLNVRYQYLKVVKKSVHFFVTIKGPTQEETVVAATNTRILDLAPGSMKALILEAPTESSVSIREGTVGR